ncbi:MAG TPA: GPW/gp25 family protein [Rhodocyclaceae bacterium]
MESDKSFLGRGWAFPPRFDIPSGRTRMVAAEDDIEESLRILLSTSPGERVMRPQYGCNLRIHVFKGITETTMAAIRESIEKAVLHFEPRVTLEKIEIDAEDAYDGLLRINLIYTVRTTNTRSNLVYPFYFLEGTNAQL